MCIPMPCYMDQSFLAKYRGVSSQLVSKACYYVGPLIIALSILVVVLINQRCPRVVFAVQHAPVRALTLLLLIFFWSLFLTSAELINAVRINGTVRVYVQPSLQYLHGSIQSQTLS